MVILHIANIDNNPFSGVSVVVPQYLRSQRKYAQVALINISNEPISGVDCQFPYHKDTWFNDLPAPFCKPDLVVFQEVYEVAFLKMSAQLRRMRIPYVIVPHGELHCQAQNKKRLKKWVANTFLFNRFIFGAEAIQCLAQTELDGTAFGRKKFLGTNGVNMPDRQKTSFRKKGVGFVYIGRLEMHMKGLDLMLEAVRLKADFMRQNGCHLDMYGPDREGRYAAVENMIREKEIGDIVTLSPAIRGQEKEDTLLGGDIFIQTSRHEGMPMGILEALSYGIPCLVTRGTHMGEIVEEASAGWTAETNAESIGKMLEKAVLERDIWEQRGNNAARLIETSYTWDVITDGIISSYKQYMKS